MHRSLILLAASLRGVQSWSCGAPLPMQADARRASHLTMGAFDDMMAKTANKDEEKATPKKPRTAAAAAPTEPQGSLAQQMFNTVSDAGVNRLFPAAAKIFGIEVDEEAEAEASAASPSSAADAANAEVADIDARAQSGDLSFNDFITMSEAFAGLGDTQLPGMPTLTPAQMAETKEKFEKHAKIVEVMLDDEKADPEMLMEDLKTGAATPGPRIQRLAQASALPATEVGLFLMQFEAMRESTRRIAAGEDPDAVNSSMAAPPGANRQARRNAKKNAARAAKKEKSKR